MPPMTASVAAVCSAPTATLVFSARLALLYSVSPRRRAARLNLSDWPWRMRIATAQRLALRLQRAMPA